MTKIYLKNNNFSLLLIMSYKYLCKYTQQIYKVPLKKRKLTYESMTQSKRLCNPLFGLRCTTITKYPKYMMSRRGILLEMLRLYQLIISSTSCIARTVFHKIKVIFLKGQQSTTVCPWIVWRTSSLNLLKIKLCWLWLCLFPFARCQGLLKKWL